MKANELRIGNYATDNIQTGVITVFNNEACVLKHKSGIVKCKVSDLNPIELSESILKQFGFKLVFGGSGDANVYRFGEKCNTMEVINRGYGFKYNTFNSCEIKIQYVHQLQNLYFALTGEELTFKSE